MDADVQAFLDKVAEKSAAKQEMLVALGAAKLADHKAENAETDEARERHQAKADEQWAIVEAKGLKNGDEGRAYAEAYALAEAYVDSHPEQFASFKDLDFEVVHTLISALNKSGRTEEAGKLTMFELVTFDRQHIGQAVKVTKRVR